jgi:hypothetical protein
MIKADGSILTSWAWQQAVCINLSRG